MPDDRRQPPQDRQRPAADLGRMGSFDLDIATGSTRWSDEFYRILGVEPQSFEPSFERFLTFVHPDDRPSVEHAQQRAITELEPYNLVCRITRSDGSVRLIERWTEVTAGSDGRAARVRGICRDVTDEHRAEEQLRASRDRLATIAEATPDALLVVDRRGVICEANDQVLTVFGYAKEELVGQPIELLLPDRLRRAHEDHRTRFFADPQPRSMGVGLALFARAKDGHELPVDVALGTITEGTEPRAVAIVRDISERRRAEELAAQLRNAEVARRQALEINDNVVQGLVTALLRLELLDLGQSDVADGLRRTLDAARGIISDLLGDGDIEPGALVRTMPADEPNDR